MRILFKVTLRATNLAPMTTWTELQEAFETYQRSVGRQRNRDVICSKISLAPGEPILPPDGIDGMVRELLKE